MAKPPPDCLSYGHPMRDGAVTLDDAVLAELFVEYAVGAALMEVRDIMDERGQSELGEWLAEAMNCSGAFEGVEPRLAVAIRETVKAYGDEYGIPERYVRQPDSAGAGANLFWTPDSPAQRTNR